jgi:processive 1,2-diacylglycerol beta-glucosyltransferase
MRAVPAAAELEEIRRVLILSADIGSGHLVAARALADELEARGVDVVVEEDLRSSLGLLPRLVIRDGSRVLFAHGPRLYDLYYRLLLRFWPARAMAAASLRRSGGRRLLRLVRRHDPDAIVSTYPGVTVVLGQLRRRRRLSVPVLAMITDLAGLFFWAHRGVDMHLLAWEESAAEVERISRSNNATHVLAPTDSAFFAPVDPAAARARRGLPAHGRLVLVSGGGWGVGGLEQTVAAALVAAPELVVVLAGRNESARRALEQRFAGDAHVRVLGYTTEMSDLLAAVDVLIHATGGVTCLEAALRGCPTIVHGFAVGHVRHNANAMSRLGLVSRARDDADLTATIRSILARPRAVHRPPPRARLPSAAEVVAAARPRIRPMPRWWLAARRISPTGAALAVALALSTSGGYAIAAGVEDDFAPVRHVTVSQPEVALVASPAPNEVQPLLERLAAAQLPVTVAVTTPPPAEVAAAAAQAGVEIVPALGSGQAVHWFATSERLEAIRTDLGESGRRPYIAPDRGFTLGQYVLGRTAHGYPVRPLRRSADAIRAGDIVEAGDWGSIQELERGLRDRGMRLTNLSLLLADAAGGPAAPAR